VLRRVRVISLARLLKWVLLHPSLCTEPMVLRVAVTGATGFVGRSLVPQLQKAGHDLNLLMRNPASNSLLESVRIVKGDLHDSAALRDLTSAADVVLHVAGAVSAPSVAEFMHVNLDGTVEVAKAAKANEVKRFVYVSSVAAREPSLNGYCASKASAEAALEGFASDFELCVLRPSAVYGPSDTATLPLLQALMSKRAFIPGSASARFAMVHVEDVARALVEAVQGPEGMFVIHDGAPSHSWPELVALARQQFARPSSVTYIPRAVAVLAGLAGDVVARVRGRPSLVNSGQIQQIYHGDWSVSGGAWPLSNPISLQDGLPQTIRWYQQQGLLPMTEKI
jgi:nucleoside-diphosphate-sugar epimerase